MHGFSEPCRRSWLRARAVFLCAVVATLACFGRVALSHPPVATAAIVKVDRSGVIDITLVHDVLAFALNDQSQNIPDGPMFELLNGPDKVLAAALREAATRFESLTILSADGTRVPVRVVSYPSAAEVLERKARKPDYPLPIKLELHATAAVPVETKSLRLRFPEMLGIVVVTIDRPGEEPMALPLDPNELSPALNVSLGEGSRGPGDNDGVGGGDTRHGGTRNASGPLDSDTTRAGASPTTTPRRTEDSGWAGVFARFTRLGFEHILPGGPDHALFVLGLFLLSPRLRPVVLQISAFTVAHTITLTLTSLNVIGLPSSIVEPAIAASIAFVGVENLCTTKVHAWRSAVAFLFGLVHGMGVATAFNEAGFPAGQLVPSLAAFTVGVEGGHLAILFAAFLALGWTAQKPWYRARVAIPLSLGISAIALVWFVQRLG